MEPMLRTPVGHEDVNIGAGALGFPHEIPVGPRPVDGGEIGPEANRAGEGADTAPANHEEGNNG